MKLQEVTEKTIGESTFYIRPFAAFKCARISGDLVKTLGPVLGGLAPLLNSFNDENADIMDMDIEQIMPSIVTGLSTVDGDKLEALTKELLIDHDNISVSNDELTNGKVKKLNYDLANEIFCMEFQDMLVLCWEVIKINFGDFFKNIGIQFGGLQEAAQKIPRSKNGER